MQLKSNSDWIVRRRRKDLTGGIALVAYYDQSWFAHGAHWIDDLSTGAHVSENNNLNGYLRKGLSSLGTSVRVIWSLTIY